MTFRSWRALLLSGVQERPRSSSVARGLFVVVALLSVGAICWGLSMPNGQGAGRSFLADLCLGSTTPVEARVSDEAADLRLSVVVPEHAPTGPLDAKAQTAKKGQVIAYDILSRQTGAVAVHGLLEPVPVQAGQTIHVVFRAIYSGRFPLHFHGADGSHFEIAGMDVLP
jgi:hypothetical protein